MSLFRLRIEDVCYCYPGQQKPSHIIDSVAILSIGKVRRLPPSELRRTNHSFTRSPVRPQHHAAN